jgi:hypothetical protein
MTALAALPGGWAADRFGRVPRMLLGMASSALQMLLFGTLLALGSAAFSTSNWALAADLALQGESARFLGLANLGTAGAAALAGLFGLLIDLGNGLEAGAGFCALRRRRHSLHRKCPRGAMDRGSSSTERCIRGLPIPTSPSLVPGRCRTEEELEPSVLEPTSRRIRWSSS